MTFKSLILVISFLGYLLFFIYRIKVRPLVAPFVWACFVVVVTYFFAIAGKLSWGVNFTLYLGFFAGGSTIFHQRAILVKNIKAPLFIIIFLLPLAISYYAIPDDFMFLLWDEVGGWARSQKLIYDTNALLNANSPFSLRSYPPGQQIFQYFFTKATFWSEKNLLIAQNIFIFSALLAVAGSLFKRQIWACVVYISLIPFIYYFKFDYNTIYCDPLIAAVFAACLALALKGNSKPSDPWILAICLCGFVLLKDIAIVFTALIIFVYGLTIFNTISASKAAIKNRAFELVKSLIIPLLGVTIVVLSWKWYVSVIGTSKTEIISLTIDSFIQEPYRQRAGLTFTAFIHALLKPEFFTGSFKHITFNISLALFILIIVVLNGLTILFSPKEKRLNTFLIALSIAGGAIGYLLFLLWLYLTYFTEYEGTRLASFDRYAMTYILAWLLATYAWLMSAITNRYQKKYALVIPVIFGIVIYCFVPNKFYTDIQNFPVDQASFQKRKATQALSDSVRKYIKPGEKVYFLAQNTNGYERHLFDYAMLPFPPNDCWSIGKKYGEGDVWTCDQPLGLLIKGYAYLAIFNADKRFWEENHALFDPEGQGRSSGVYKIYTSAEGNLRLKLAEQ